MPAEHLLYFFECLGDLLLCVSCHKAETNERIGRRNGRRNHRVDKDALLKELGSDEESEVVVADVKWNNRSLGVANLATHLFEALKGIVGDVPQVLLTLGLAFKNVERGAHGGGRGRSDACGEDIGALMVTQEVGNDLVGGDEATQRSKRLAESTHD